MAGFSTVKFSRLEAAISKGADKAQLEDLIAELENHLLHGFDSKAADLADVCLSEVEEDKAGVKTMEGELVGAQKKNATAQAALETQRAHVKAMVHEIRHLKDLISLKAVEIQHLKDQRVKDHAAFEDYLQHLADVRAKLEHLRETLPATAAALGERAQTADADFADASHSIAELRKQEQEVLSASGERAATTVPPVILLEEIGRTTRAEDVQSLIQVTAKVLRGDGMEGMDVDRARDMLAKLVGYTVELRKTHVEAEDAAQAELPPAIADLQARADELRAQHRAAEDKLARFATARDEAAVSAEDAASQAQMLAAEVDAGRAHVVARRSECLAVHDVDEHQAARKEQLDLLKRVREQIGHLKAEKAEEEKADPPRPANAPTVADLAPAAEGEKGPLNVLQGGFWIDSEALERALKKRAEANQPKPEPKVEEEEVVTADAVRPVVERPVVERPKVERPEVHRAVKQVSMTGMTGGAVVEDVEVSNFGVASMDTEVEPVVEPIVPVIPAMTAVEASTGATGATGAAGLPTGPSGVVMMPAVESLPGATAVPAFIPATEATVVSMPADPFPAQLAAAPKGAGIPDAPTEAEYQHWQSTSRPFDSIAAALGNAPEDEFLNPEDLLSDLEPVVEEEVVAEAPKPAPKAAPAATAAATAATGATGAASFGTVSSGPEAEVEAPAATAAATATAATAATAAPGMPTGAAATPEEVKKAKANDPLYVPPRNDPTVVVPVPAAATGPVSAEELAAVAAEAEAASRPLFAVPAADVEGMRAGKGPASPTGVLNAAAPLADAVAEELEAVAATAATGAVSVPEEEAVEEEPKRGVAYADLTPENPAFWSTPPELEGALKAWEKSVDERVEASAPVRRLRGASATGSASSSEADTASPVVVEKSASSADAAVSVAEDKLAALRAQLAAAEHAGCAARQSKLAAVTSAAREAASSLAATADDLSADAARGRARHAEAVAAVSAARAARAEAEAELEKVETRLHASASAKGDAAAGRRAALDLIDTLLAHVSSLGERREEREEAEERLAALGASEGDKALKEAMAGVANGLHQLSASGMGEELKSLTEMLKSLSTALSAAVKVTSVGSEHEADLWAGQRKTLEAEVEAAGKEMDAKVDAANASLEAGNEAREAAGKVSDLADAATALLERADKAVKAAREVCV